MRRRFQFVAGVVRVFSHKFSALAGILMLAGVLACPAAVLGQGAVLPVIGHVEGNDISCESGTPETGQYSTVGTRLDVSDGTVVTVHSGQALMTLVAGGEVGICGPAKLTVLLSGNAITLALNFGRVRVELPAKTDLRIFTPTLVGTPLDISGGARDVTVGLSLDDSLCVVASSGAIQLEHQFTGEKMIVPQSGEFFLNAGKLVAVAGTPGSCKCTASGATIAPAPQPEFATAAPSTPPAIPSIPPAAMSSPNAGSAVAPATANVETSTPPAPERPVQYAQLSEANETHPVPHTQKERPATPPGTNATYTAVLPPLTFSAGSPPPPPASAADQVLLVREAHVSPAWEFSGHVEPPAFAKAMSHALGESAAPAKTKPAKQPPASAAVSPAPPVAADSQTASAAAEPAPAPEPLKRRGGFWSSLKRIFGGQG
jgi:hypothetical protein